MADGDPYLQHVSLNAWPGPPSRCYGPAGRRCGFFRRFTTNSQPSEARHAAVFRRESTPTALEQHNMIGAVIEMSKARQKRLIAGLVRGFKRQPVKEIDADL
ncbi:hypothetical protein BQ8482_290120 [Mesorhizobium delmotii]|uniref:Uncharacterized protein n=1 Tax=Mesorhizobium delmotii TaxID=1631247 RepID=A0A2P9AN19_9HYPH|nr:hypothetical protein BQ8482_290120 [Mesorhizobium delmotii]